MKFNVETAINGFTVKVDENEELHVARTAEEVAEIVVSALGGTEEKPKRGRKPRGKNKKKAVAAANSDALAGLNA